jgi:Glycosyl transferase family 2
MAAAPRVSVIIPTYNRSNVLRHAIASVLRQSFADYELLVVGDGCSDDSAAIVAGFADARIRWINLPVNSGHQSAPNNEGLRQARGELIAASQSGGDVPAAARRRRSGLPLRHQCTDPQDRRHDRGRSLSTALSWQCPSGSMPTDDSHPLAESTH